MAQVYTLLCDILILNLFIYNYFLEYPAIVNYLHRILTCSPYQFESILPTPSWLYLPQFPELPILYLSHWYSIT